MTFNTKRLEKNALWKDLGFKPCYKWMTFNTKEILILVCWVIAIKF
ncbi:hypothetical protein HMPREF1500_1096 [Fusobacterium sp. CM22]|nr:hypothetical protein HMPREF1500_1096 [Fusobacterium sp. CM22]